MIVLNSVSAGALLFLASIHSEIRKYCIACLSKTYLFVFQVWKGVLRLNCADKLDSVLGPKDLMIHTRNNNNYINVYSR